MEIVEISTEYIKLQQALKLSGVIGQGSDIKVLISENVVSVNGESATQRGKKLIHNDLVNVKGCGNFKIISTAENNV